MKIYFNGYPNHWLSPYTFLEKIIFWKKEIEYDDPVIEKWAKRIEPLCKVLQKVRKTINPEIRYVKIDRYDTWSMDHTLAPIILPMLKQLRDTKHGSPYVDFNDVPEELRGTTTEEYEDQSTFEFYREDEIDNYKNLEARWDWILNEMIFAFEHMISDDWQDKFRSGEHDVHSVPCKWDEEGKPTLYTFEKGPKDTFKCDWDAIFAVEKRMNNGFRLFGTYYRNLWD